MAQRYPEWIWHNGAIKPWAEATTHVMAHALHYGRRCSRASAATRRRRPAIFRLTDHTRRLFASAKIYDMPIPYSVGRLNAACRAVLGANGFEGLPAPGRIPLARRLWIVGRHADRCRRVRVGNGTVPRPTDVIAAGIDACVSSWQRLRAEHHSRRCQGRRQLPVRPAGRARARRLGFGEGIALASDRTAERRRRARTCSWCSTAPCTRRR
jgi:branched-chain amino acid aminotransferase